jgi:Tfp pilus assembly protein PilO
MKASDRTVLLVLLVVGALAAFWFLLISPKRDEVTKLDSEIATVRTSVDQQEQLALAAEQAEEDYPSNYQRLVVLGKAVPTDSDTSSLFVELDEIAADADVEFRSIELTESEGGATPAPASQTTVDGAAGAGEPTESAEETPAVPPAATPVATEASAATLPIGATIGPAGLPVMPYAIELTGDFFEIADFLASVDSLVRTGERRPLADGRLITVDGFDLAMNQAEGFPVLDATLSVTTYVTPSDQGATAGATPQAPAPTIPTAPAATPTATPAAVATPTP